MERDSTDGGGVDLELGDLAPVEPWFGYLRAESTAAPPTGTPADRVAVIVQTVQSGRWSPDHVKRLLLTIPTADRDTSGLVPVVAVVEDEAGDQTVVSLRTDAPRFQERLDFRTPPPWNEGAGVALATALAVEKGHSLGLRHGALQPDDVIVAGSELAVAGMGLSLGGIPDPAIPMAPEVVRSGVPTVPGDIYSLGRLLEAGTAGDPNTPDEIAAIVADATAEEIEERIPNALAFAERLREAGAGVMRSYAPMTFADSPLFTGAPLVDDAAAVVVPTEPAETPATDPAASDDESAGLVGRALPWLVGAGLVGVIGFGLWAAATSGDGESTSPSTNATTVPSTATTTAVTTTTVPPTTQDTSPTSTSTSAPATTASSTSTSTSAPATTASSTSTSTSAPATSTSSTTSPPTTATTQTTTTTLPTPPEVPAVPASEAGLELVHGLSEPSVDVYVDRNLLVGGFASGEIAGPLDLTEGSYSVELFSAIDDPAQAAQTRTDPPLIAQALPISGRPETVVVANDADDGVVLRSFADDVSPIAPGQGRFAIRNPSSRTILVTVDPVTDGAAALERQAVSPGGVLSRDLPSGDYQLFITEEDQSPLLATVLSNPEGELTSATFLRDGSPRLILQRIGDLGTPPNGIPTGTDGLLPGSGDPTAGLLIAALGALGLFVVIGRERLLDAGRN